MTGSQPTHNYTMLVVDGDSNSAAAECVNEYAFAGDDPSWDGPPRTPHPENVKHSFARQIARCLSVPFTIKAESASSGDRIIRTLPEFLCTLKKNSQKPFVVVGWPTWEREEWFDEDTGEYVQVTASGSDMVPEKWTMRYRQWVNSLSPQELRNRQDAWHDKIWNFHALLDNMLVPHLFFNTMHHFDPRIISHEYDWKGSYFMPYSRDHTFHEYLCRQGFEPRRNWHHGAYAHRMWGDRLYGAILTLEKAHSYTPA